MIGMILLFGGAVVLAMIFTCYGGWCEKDRRRR